MSPRSFVSTTGLLARHLRSRAAASIALALLIAVGVAIAVLLPRVTVLVSDAELHDQVGAAAPGVSDLYGTGTLGPLNLTNQPTAQQLFGQTDSTLAGVPDSLPAPLQTTLGTVSWVAVLPPDPVTLDEPRSLVQPVLNLAVDLRWRERVTLVEGDVPSAPRGTASGLVEMAISKDYAELAGFRVGDVVDYIGTRVIVSGIYTAKDPEAAYWVHAPELLTPTVTSSPGALVRVRGGAFIDPAAAAVMPTSLERSELRAWYPILAETMTYADVPQLDDQLKRVVSLGLYLPTGESLSFGTGLLATFERVSAPLATSAALLAIVSSAPLGAFLAVLALGARTVADRRRAVLALAESRGASSLQSHAAMLLEGVLISLPSAVVASLGANAILPSDAPPHTYVLPGLIAAALPLFFVTSMRLTQSRREDVGARERHGRWILEALVVGVAALAVFLLMRRGLLVGENGAIDPLLALAPLLITLVVCVVVLRLLPLPLLAIQRATKTGKSSVSLVGATGAVRANTVAYPFVFATVVAVSATVFCLVLVSTVTAGLKSTAESLTGSDINVSAVTLDDVDAIRSITGVAGAAGLFTAYGVDLALGADTRPVTAVFADLEALHEVRPDIPNLPLHSVLVSRDIADRGQAATTVNGFPVAIAGTVPSSGLPGMTGSWVLADLADAPSVFGRTPRIGTMLVSVEPGAGIADTADAVRNVVTDAQSPENRDRVTVIDTATLTADAAARPSVAGVILGLTAGAALSLILCVIAVSLEALGAANRRSRTRGILQLLGMSAAQLRGVLVWEFAPVAITAIAAGTGFGVVTAVVVANLLDLRNLTGGTTAIAASVPGIQVGVVIALFAIVVAVTATLTSAGARRLNAAAAVKMGAE